MSIDTSENFRLPTLKELNRVSCAEVSLLHLRCLNTSDLGWHYMNLKVKTLEDICETCRQHLIMDGESMTEQEQKEFKDYLKDIEDYIDHIDQMHKDGDSNYV